VFPQLFHRQSTGKDKEKDAVTRTEIELIMARFERVESQMKLIRTEWEDTYEKMSHLYDRARKRIKAAKGAQDPSDKAIDGEPSSQPSSPQTHADLMNIARNRRFF